LGLGWQLAFHPPCAIFCRVPSALKPPFPPLAELSSRFRSAVLAVDAHAGGEPGRVIVAGVADVPGRTLFEKRVYLETHMDDLRKRMLREPRGYPAANCNLILPPSDLAADAGFVIMEQTEYPPMSGTNTICVVTVLLETGMLPAREPTTRLVLETPAGLVTVDAEVSRGKVTRVTFRNVPAFAVHLDAPLEVRGLGTLKVDVAYGGMFYVIADATRLGLRLEPREAREIVRLGEMIKAAAREQLPAVHPENPAISGVSIAELTAPPRQPGAHGRNAVVVSTGQLDWSRPESWTGVLDRSPCGTGTCARMAALRAKRLLPFDQDFVHEGILNTTFTGRLVAETRVGDFPAVIPTLSGRAWITGFAQYVVDEDDPFPDGFTVGDIWGGGVAE
jgi:proline racemase